MSGDANRTVRLVLPSCKATKDDVIAVIREHSKPTFEG